MPNLRKRLAGGPTQGSGWKPDPAHKFRSRYHNGTEFTPYVGSAEQVIWDLGFCARMPDGPEWDDTYGITLVDANAQIMLTREELTLSWCGSQGRQASAAITPNMLETYELRYTADPTLIELCIGASEFSRSGEVDRVSSYSGIINMSFIFGREHESALYELREFIARYYHRPFTESARHPVAPLQEADRRQDNTGDRLKGTGSGEPPSGGAVPSTLAAAEVGQWRPSDDKHARQELITLTVSVETAPDSEDWLSFAGASPHSLLGDDRVRGGKETGPTFTPSSSPRTFDKDDVRG